MPPAFFLGATVYVIGAGYPALEGGVDDAKFEAWRIV